MRKRFSTAAMFLLAAAAPAQAITFATGQGTDGAGCGAVASPCRTLQQAVTNTPAGGYVVLRGPANFGQATIDKSITLAGEAGAKLSGAGGSNPYGVVVIIAGANDTIRLRGLTIADAPPGGAGIAWVTGKALEIAYCAIPAGVMPNVAAGGQFSILDSAVDGIFAGSQSARISSYLDGLRSSKSVFTGFWHAQDAMTVLVNSSVTGSPVAIRNALGDLIARNTVVSNSGIAFTLDSLGSIRLSRSTVTGNAKIFEERSAGDPLYSYGDNVIRGNADETLPQTLPATYH